MGSSAKYLVAFFLLQFTFLGCEADAIDRVASAAQYNTAISKVTDTLEKYSTFSLVEKVSEVNKGLSKVKNFLNAMNGPAGAVIAFIQIGVGTIEGRR